MSEVREVEPVVAVFDQNARRDELIELIVELFTESEVKSVIEDNLMLLRARPGVVFCRIAKYASPFTGSQITFPRDTVPTIEVVYRVSKLTITDYLSYSDYLARVEQRQ